MERHKRVKAKRSFGGKILDMFRSMDIYGKSIVLNYKGKETYTTHFGGAVSIIIYCVLFGYFAVLFKMLIERDETNVTKNTYEK